jgi:predicted dienelactone hydrolase
MRTISSWCLFVELLILPWTAAIAMETDYDPLELPKSELPKPLELRVNDDARSREIRLRVYLPVKKSLSPVVLFSHGLGGSRLNNPYLGRHWSARGYVVVFMQHAGSDAALWKNARLTERMDALRQAANLENFMLRAKDVPIVLDQLERWNAEAGHELEKRMDLEHIGMSGHSFGAVTTQAVSGQTFPLRGAAFIDERIKAAVMFSPSSPRQGDPQRAFGSVKIPWMLMTATKDVALIGGTDVESRLAVYPALPAGEKYEVVLHDGEHSAFSDRELPGDKLPRNPNHHRVILALSTAFWDAYLRDDTQAKAWLDGNGPQRVLEKGDRWQKK